MVSLIRTCTCGYICGCVRVCALRWECASVWFIPDVVLGRVAPSITANPLITTNLRDLFGTEQFHKPPLPSPQASTCVPFMVVCTCMEMYIWALLLLTCVLLYKTNKHDTVHVHTHTCTCTTCTCMYMYGCVHVHVHVCTCTCTGVYMYMYTPVQHLCASVRLMYGKYCVGVKPIVCSVVSVQIGDKWVHVWTAHSCN